MNAFDLYNTLNNLSCENIPTDLKLIGAGGFGEIYESGGIIIKAIKDDKDCQAARKEMENQMKIYKAFEKLKSVKLPFNIKVSRPLGSCDNSIIIDGKHFSCYFLMEKLYGIPIEMLKQYRSLDKISDDYLKNLDSLMLHLSQNSDFDEQVFGIKYDGSKIDVENPPRGYFTNRDGKLLDEMGIKDMREIIGFIYGYIFYHAGMDPKDIEITLGIDNGKYVINVLDFGMISEGNDEKKVIENISLDLYCDLEDDEECKKGWNMAKNLSF